MRQITIVLTIFLLFTCSVFAATPHFVAGKDYQVIQVPAAFSSPQTTKPGKILVQEFFSYGCPWCFRLEPDLEKWLQTKPANVEFKRVPVVFEQGWQMYSKAYFTAQALGINAKITPIIFNAIHKKHENLLSPEAMARFFASQGIKQSEFSNIFLDSPTINLELQQAQQMMMAYKVFEIPTFVVAGKYKSSLAMAKSSKRLLQIVDFLVHKVAKEQASK